ncbi:MAG: hypothetical protein V1865_01085 [bacterium]
MRRFPTQYYRTVGRFLWNQARRAPVLMGILVAIIIIFAWPSCDRQDNNPVVAQQEQGSGGSQKRAELTVQAPRATQREAIINEWKQEGFQIFDDIVLLEGDTSKIYSFTEDFRYVGESGKRLFVRRLQDENGVELSNTDHYDSGTDHTSLYFIGLESSTHITILTR